MNNQSTFWALAAVLGVIILAAIAISNVDEGPVRRPFSASASPTDNVSEADNPWFQKVEDKPKFDDLAVSKLIDEESSQEIRIENFKTLNFDTDQTTVNTDQIAKFTLDKLIAAGLNNPSAKRMPFTGRIFGRFNLNELTSYNPKQALIFERVNGFDLQAFEVYAFEDLDQEMSTEIFTLIKSNLERDISVTLNQNNIFGLASFFINFSPPLENAFLVVKYPDSVYALAYPKANSLTNQDYFSVLKQML